MQVIEVTSEEDVKTVEKLAFEIWNEYYPSIIGHDQVDYMLTKFQTSEAIRQQIQESQYYFLLYQDKTAIGYMSLRQDDPHTLFLSKLYIKAPHRKKGYASIALEFVRSFALSLGLKRITLTVNRHNHTAIEAYRRLGFTQTRSLVQDIGRGFVMDDFCFECECQPLKQTIADLSPK